MKANEEATFIFRMKNPGKEAWPEDTQVYVIDYDKAPFNNSGSIIKSMKCGSCRPSIFKQIDFKF